ncbi:hypothetical protein DFH06DRAFT_1103445 [Mycena polygramma]|nr:hypothetical protein DFH06DRAFT_1103445 [Mycena polygramma]
MYTPVSPPESQKAVNTPRADGDHRKRRRNRTTQSCLNCQATKRMCDRKRPSCTRCVQLCISGNCLYEMDDPNRNAEQQSEGARLMNRIAELEAVIREVSAAHCNKTVFLIYHAAEEDRVTDVPKDLTSLGS